MLAILNIPKHTNCVNCGSCCGLIPLSSRELKAIKDYVAANDVAIGKASVMNCPFRDEANKRCAIYPVRPLMCRLMGVAKGCDCPNGNSHNINGSVFMDDYEFGDTVILNFVKWGEA